MPPAGGVAAPALGAPPSALSRVAGALAAGPQEGGEHPSRKYAHVPSRLHQVSWIWPGLPLEHKGGGL